MNPNKPLITFVKTRRTQLGLTQEQLAERAGVGLRFIRDLEQGYANQKPRPILQVCNLEVLALAFYIFSQT